MPYRLTPQDIVTMLEESLQKVETMADQAQQVKDIRKKLDLIKGYYPDLKKLEMRIIEKFENLGSSISRDDVLKKHDDVDGVKQRLQLIDGILTEIKKITKEKIELKEDKVFTGQGSFSRCPKTDTSSSSSSYNSQFHIETRLLESQAISSLKISFENLDHLSRLCSLCLSVFPEDSEIKKRPLIYWWIGEGFFRDSESKVAEELVGEDIFNKLCRKGLVQAVYRDKNPIVDSCKIHPWMRKMLLGVLQESKFSEFQSKIYNGDPMNQLRRVNLVEADNIGSQIRKRDMKMLGTVFNVDKKHLQIESEVLSGLKRVKVLQLGRWQRLLENHIELEVIGDTKKPRDDSQEALISLGAMKQLRYLSLQGISGVSDLPESIKEVINLEILDLRACHNLGKLPSNIGMLRNLTHLDVTECYFLENMPKGIEKLSLLQVLKGFMIGTDHTSSCKLRDLSRLTRLRKLSIYIRDKAYNIEEHGEFRKNVDLRSLTITWGGGTSRTQQVTQSETMKSNKTKPMEFPKSLEKLDLRCYPLNTAPEWLSPAKHKELKKLYIRGGWLESLYDKEVNDDRYEKLRILRLKYLKRMKNVVFKVKKKDVPLPSICIDEKDKEFPSICIDGKDKEFPSLEYYEMATSKDEKENDFKIEEWSKVYGLIQRFTRKEEELFDSSSRRET